MPDLTDSALREMLSEILDIKDEITLVLAGKGTLSHADIQRIRRALDPMRGQEVAAQMEEVLGRYSKWAFGDGMAKIDAGLGGGDLAAVLNVPPTTADVTAAYDNSRIVTIAPQLLDEVRSLTTLSFLGNRTPDQIARKIAERFEVSMGRAETIVRTEGKRLQNFGAEARIVDVAAKARSLDIPMVRYWIHSSGAKVGFRAGKSRARYEPRPHHKAMHGVTVKPEEKFILTNPSTFTTYHIDGPHDPLLPAEEVVHCSCDRSLRIDREAMKAGTVTTVTPPAIAPTPAPATKSQPQKAVRAKTPKAAKPAKALKPSPSTEAPTKPVDGGYRPIDKELAKKTDAARALLDGTMPGLHGYRDSAGGEIVKQLGLDGKPKIVSAQEYADMPGREYHRGVYATNAKAAEKYADQFYRGKLYYGRGIYGDGIYAAVNRDDAAGYAKLGKAGKMTRFKLNPDAKIVDIDNLRSQLFNYRKTRKDVLGVPFERWQYYTDDEFALMLGFDAIYVETHGYLVLLNRTAAVSDGAIGDPL